MIQGFGGSDRDDFAGPRTLHINRVMAVQACAPRFLACLSMLESQMPALVSCHPAADVPRLALKSGAELVLLWADADGHPSNVCSRLRASGLTVPILCLSERVRHSLEERVLNSGGDGVVSCLDEELVRATCSALLRRSRRAYQIEISPGVWFDCARRTLVVGSSETSLTPAILDLFEILACATEASASVEAILKALNLRLAGDAGAAFVRQRVGALRKALLGSGLSVTFSSTDGVKLCAA